MQAIIGGILRALLALFAGTVGTTNQDIGVAVNTFIDGIVSGEPNQIGSAILTVGVIVWSIYSKKKDAKKDEKPAA